MYGPQSMYNASPNHYAPQKARKMIENYSYGLTDQIGKGFSSKVFKGKNETNQELVAVKVIDLQMLKTPLHHQLLKSEIDALSLLNHQNIMKLHKVFQTSNNTYLITEFCDGGDLASRVTKGKQPESFTLQVIAGVVSGYKEMKRNGIIHRDIKPANILISNGVPKIADFGFATTPMSPPMQANVNVGSPLYMSPQALKQNRYSAASDIWAIGVTVFEMLYGQVPWQASSEKELAQKMQTVPVHFPGTVAISQECQDFIRKCLIVDENRRITVEEMEQHPWLQNRFKLQQTPGNHFQSKKPSSQYGVPLGDTNKSKESLNSNLNKDFYGKENSSNAPIKRIDRKSPIKKQPFRQSFQSENLYKNERSITQEHQSKVTITPEETQKNDQIVLAQINFCRYLNRISGLIEKVQYFNSPNIRDKLNFFVQKNIMMKIHKLREMVQQPPVNTLNLPCFPDYSQGTSFSKIASVIHSYYSKFALNFSTLWLGLQPQRSVLSQDKKFDAIFDENLTEFESFYIILLSVVRSSVRDLDQQLDETLNAKEQEADQQLPLPIEDGVVLLDYLVTYFQLTALILDQFNDYEVFATQSKIEQIAEGKPVRLTYGHFLEIRNKIQQLEI